MDFRYVGDLTVHSNCTRNTLAYDASRRSKLHVQVGRAAKVSGVPRLVGAQRAVQNNGNVKSGVKCFYGGFLRVTFQNETKG